MCFDTINFIDVDSEHRIKFFGVIQESAIKLQDTAYPIIEANRYQPP